MNPFTPCLWFDGNAEQAATFYVSIFENSRLTGTTHYGEAAAKVSGQPTGSVMTVSFELGGQVFLALNGGPAFQFTPAISFIVHCRSQKEIDRLWDRLSDGGQIMDCGWVTDKFGVSWQIVPAGMDEMIQDEPPGRAERVMQAMLTMKKLDMAALKRAGGG